MALGVHGVGQHIEITSHGDNYPIVSVKLADMPAVLHRLTNPSSSNDGATATRIVLEVCNRLEGIATPGIAGEIAALKRGIKALTGAQEIADSESGDTDDEGD